MISFIKCSSSCDGFVRLTKLLDEELALRNGADQAEYDKYNVIEEIETVIVAEENGEPIACGCFKEYAPGCAEIKRMYVCAQHRGRGISKKLLGKLEIWAKQLGYSEVILETGMRQTEAIALYKKCGYGITENYGQYKNMTDSICFSKKI